MYRESYFLDMGLIGMLRNINYLSVITTKDVYEFIESEYRNNPHWQDEKLFTLKTFYEWLRIGKAHHINKTESTHSLLYQEVHRLKNSLRQENQERLSIIKLDEINQTQLVRLVYLEHKRDWQLEKSKLKTRENQNIYT